MNSHDLAMVIAFACLIVACMLVSEEGVAFLVASVLLGLLFWGFYGVARLGIFLFGGSQ